MRVVAWISTLTNVVVIAGLLIYFTVVALNLTFTFNFLTVDDVPFYDNPTDNILGESLSNRYHIEYWVYASDFLRFIPPILLPTVIGLSLLESGKVWAMSNVWIIVLLGILEILKLIWRVIQFGFCDDFQFCRPFDPAVMTSAFGPTNFIWEWTVYFNAAWIVVLVVYLILAVQVESGARKFYKDLQKEGYVVREARQAEKDYKSLKDMYEIVRSMYKSYNLK